MSFNGTRESCPPIEEEWNDLVSANGLKMSGSAGSPTYDYSEFGTSDFNRECFNICETGDLNDGVPTLHHYIENGVCKPCPEPGDTEKVNDLRIAGLIGMCSNLDEGRLEINNVPTWFTRQQQANLRGDFRNQINWNIYDPTGGNDYERGPLSFWRGAQRGMTINEINMRLGGTRVYGSENYSFPMNPETNQSYTESELREAINQGRGSVVPCNGDTRPQGDDTDFDEATDCVTTSDGTFFGPEFIVPEEVRDFYVTNILNRRIQSASMGQQALSTFSDLLSSVRGDSTFEACVNDKLNDGILNSDGDDDETIQNRIASYNNLSQFQNADIHYLKRKLRRIVTIDTDEVNECMNLLNLGQSVCRTGVADKTLQIGSLIFSIVGNDRIDVLNMSNDEQIKLNRMIDELGPLIPQAIKNIIRVSKEYESRICNVPSNTTLLLERVYIDLYDKPTEITLDFSPYIDFNSLINIDDNVRFIKTIFVLVVFAYLFMNFANIVVAFLSRGANVTKIV